MDWLFAAAIRNCMQTRNAWREASNATLYWGEATELRHALLVFALRPLGVRKKRTEQREITALSTPLVVAATKGVKPLVVFFGLQFREVAHPV